MEVNKEKYVWVVMFTVYDDDKPVLCSKTFTTSDKAQFYAEHFLETIDVFDYKILVNILDEGMYDINKYTDLDIDENAEVISQENKQLLN